MTREEEIKHKALEAFPIKERDNKKATGTYDSNLSRRKAFEEGAEWMLNEVINNACEWLEKHQDDYLDYDTWKDWYTNFEPLIKDFRTAMIKAAE